KHASLTITKSAQGGNGTFNFTGSGTPVPGTFSITTASGSGSYGPVDISSGQFSTAKYVTEMAPPTGWTLGGISCIANGATVAIGTGQGASFYQNASAGYDPGDDTVKVTVATGNTPNCTFTDALAAVTVTPSTQQYSDPVTFTATIPFATTINGNLPASTATFYVGTTGFATAQNMGSCALATVGEVLTCQLTVPL